jgi:hypothetical protein
MPKTLERPLSALDVIFTRRSADCRLAAENLMLAPALSALAPASSVPLWPP